MPQFPFARHLELEAEHGRFAVEPVPIPSTGPAPQKLPRRQSILSSLRRGLRRNHELSENAKATVVSIPGGQEGGPPSLRRRSSQPELRPKVSRRTIASLPRQQTLERSEREKGWDVKDAPFGEPGKRSEGVLQRHGWSTNRISEGHKQRIKQAQAEAAFFSECRNRALAKQDEEASSRLEPNYTVICREEELRHAASDVLAQGELCSHGNEDGWPDRVPQQEDSQLSRGRFPSEGGGILEITITEQWQAVLALHKTLHDGEGRKWYDFMTATQNPAAGPALGSIPLPNVMEPAVSGLLCDTPVTAFPDTGAAANFISLQYAQSHGHLIDKFAKGQVKLGNGSKIRILGTVTLPFSFRGEVEKHNLVFNVLRKSLHDVMLGNSFLRTSKTLTRFTHRMGQKVRKVFEHNVHKLCFLGSQQFVNGFINGACTAAVPDTGADVSVISASFAKAHGYHINNESQHCVMLRFADGSTTRALGVIEHAAWSYCGDVRTFYTDAYVLEDLPVDLVLGYDFLCQTNAFVEHEEAFWESEERDDNDAWMLSLIQLLREAVDCSRNGRSCEYDANSSTYQLLLS